MWKEVMKTCKETARLGGHAGTLGPDSRMVAWAVAIPWGKEPRALRVVVHSENLPVYRKHWEIVASCSLALVAMATGRAGGWEIMG